MDLLYKLSEVSARLNFRIDQTNNLGNHPIQSQHLESTGVFQRALIQNISFYKF